MSMMDDALDSNNSARNPLKTIADCNMQVSSSHAWDPGNTDLRACSLDDEEKARLPSAVSDRYHTGM